MTGATGRVGGALLRRLTAGGQPVRCLVRDPRRLGPERVRVQIALGDLAEPVSLRNALRGVTTVVHLAGTLRDQPAGSIEELNGIATWRMVEAAERAGVEHVVFTSALGASVHSRARFLRAKALAEQAVAASVLRTTVVAPSLTFARDDRWLWLAGRLSVLPAVPVAGRGAARFQPVWAEDVAAALAAVATRPPGGPAHTRHALAGPDTLTQREAVDVALRALGRPRPTVAVPSPLVRAACRTAEALMKSRAPATWDEAELLEVSMTTPSGTADAEALGVAPRSLAAVLGGGR
jgi:NADH dehydrogenase